MSNLPQLQYVTWSQFHHMGLSLADKIEANAITPDTIVSVSRGGHVLSRILSDFLDLPIYSVSIQSYESIEKQGELRITQELGLDLADKTVLLVDEIIDSGRTLVRSLEYLKDLGASQILSVAAHVKPKAILMPDIFVEQTDKWIVYPYEVRETIISLWPMWHKAGLTKGDLTRELCDSGQLPQEFVERFLTSLKP